MRNVWKNKKENKREREREALVRDKRGGGHLLCVELWVVCVCMLSSGLCVCVCLGLVEREIEATAENECSEKL